MIEWLYQNYKIIAGIFVPIIVATIGLFKLAPSIKKKFSIKGNKSTQLQAGRDLNNSDSFNQGTLSAAPHSTQTLVQGGQLTINGVTDMKTIEVMACGFIATMYPHTEMALNRLRLNGMKFLALLNNELKDLPKEKLEKFSEPDVQIALRNAIKAASKRNSSDVHKTLAKLLSDRVQDSNQSIVELTLDESIEAVAKLDSNLIKILSLSFIISRTKYMNLPDRDVLFKKLSLIFDSFKEITVSAARFEYLESISCGKSLQIRSGDLMPILSKNYAHLFIKDIPIEQVESLALPDEIKLLCFSKNEHNHFKFNPVMGLHLFDDQPIFINGNIPFILDNPMKTRLKEIFLKNKLSEEEIKLLLCEKIYDFNRMIDLWSNGGFAQFSLTAVGIVIGGAYLEQIGFDNYDINVWIN